MADATHADSAHIKPVAPAAEDSPVPLAAAVSSADAFRRFWPWARPDRYRLAASVVLLIAGSAGEVASVWLFKNLVDQVLIPTGSQRSCRWPDSWPPWLWSPRATASASTIRRKRAIFHNALGYAVAPEPSPQVQWKAPERVEEELEPATVPDPRQALALLDEVGKVLPHAVVRSSWPIGSALAAVRAI